MNEPKKHHYIPVFYLKAWMNEKGKLCEFSRPHKMVKERWCHPSATGYEKNLYSLPGLQPDKAEVVEKHYMSLVDSTAADAHRKLLQDGHDDLSPKESASWARFLYAMMFRNPEQIAALEERFKAYAPTVVEEYRERYPQIRRFTNPETFDEFKEKFLGKPLNVSGINSIPRLLNSGRVIGEIMSLTFSTCRLSEYVSPTFLTSDRPIIMNNGLGKPDAHIVMPISPRVLFIAARGNWLHDEISGMQGSKVAKTVNEHVTCQSHRYVYGADAFQYLFVSKRLGQKAPSTPFG